MDLNGSLASSSSISSNTLVQASFDSASSAASASASASATKRRVQRSQSTHSKRSPLPSLQEQDPDPDPDLIQPYENHAVIQLAKEEIREETAEEVHKEEEEEGEGDKPKKNGKAKSVTKITINGGGARGGGVKAKRHASFAATR